MRIVDQWQGIAGPTWQAEFQDLDEQLRFLRKLVSGPKVRIDGRLIGNYRTHPAIRELALKTIREANVEARDKREQALAIGQWVQDNIYYVHESPERFQTPLHTLRIKAGDCDDFTTLICSLLESIGIPNRFVCMQINGVWKHIFPAALMANGKLLPLDGTMKSHQVREVVNPISVATEAGKQVKIKLA